MTRLYLTLLFFIFTPVVWSADHVALEKLFKEVFSNENIYTENYCGLNIQRFYQLAHSKGINLDHTYLVRALDYSGASIEGVTMRESRESGCAIRPTPDKPPLREPGIRNVFHHIFLLADDLVYDFDFLNTPTVVPLAEYMIKMFIERRKWNSTFEWRRTLGLHSLELFQLTVTKGKLDMVADKKGKIKELYPDWVENLPPGCGDLLIH